VAYERLASTEMRRRKAKEIYDHYIYVELLTMNAEVKKKFIKKKKSYKSEFKSCACMYMCMYACICGSCLATKPPSQIPFSG